VRVCMYVCVRACEEGESMEKERGKRQRCVDARVHVTVCVYIAGTF